MMRTRLILAKIVLYLAWRIAPAELREVIFDPVRHLDAIWKQARKGETWGVSCVGWASTDDGRLKADAMCGEMVRTSIRYRLEHDDTATTG